MPLIIATGTNLGNKIDNLTTAKKELCKYLNLKYESKIYKSSAVDYTDQPDFYNQVLEFETPNIEPLKILKILNEIETKLGRIRTINKGPRTVDLDIIFIDELTIDTEKLQVPHPRWSQRSFVVLPLKELPFYKQIESKFIIPDLFNEMAYPI